MGRDEVNVCFCLIVDCDWKASNARSPSVDGGGVSSNETPRSASDWFGCDRSCGEM